MRVTKAISDYVTEAISKKYDEQIAEIGREYKAKRNALADEFKRIAQEADAKAAAIAYAHGFRRSTSYRGENKIIIFNEGSFEIPDEVTRIIQEEQDWRAKKHEKIQKVLFDLEVGDTEKAELKAILDNITVD